MQNSSFVAKVQISHNGESILVYNKSKSFHREFSASDYPEIVKMMPTTRPCKEYFWVVMRNDRVIVVKRAADRDW